MASPRFVVKRIGNDYKILPADAQGVALSALPLAGGGILALKGLFRGGLFGQLMFLTGSGLVYYGITGKNPIDEVRKVVDQFNNQGGGDQNSDHGPLPPARRQGPEQPATPGRRRRVGDGSLPPAAARHTASTASV